MKRRAKPADIFYSLLCAVLVCAAACCYWPLSAAGTWFPAPVLAVLFGLVNLRPALPRPDIPTFRLRVCRHGAACLKIFLLSATVCVFYHLVLAAQLFPQDWKSWTISALLCFCLEALLFWNGILSVYFTSVQLGIRLRVVGALCGLIPIVHLIVLRHIIETVTDEVDFETEKARIDLLRHEAGLCATRYPLLFVHGVFFRDSKLLNYWGRIPDELQQNGARIFYGNHQSAASVADSARELTARIREIVRQTGCEKVNIIAHSKGGLDCRYAIAQCGAAPFVASITTVNTPHRGCEFAEYLLNKIPLSAQHKIARAYNSALLKLGDTNPDFMAAVRDLTAGRCRELNTMMPTPSGILCQSVGSRLCRAAAGKFPLNFTYPLVRFFDGPNDGLVAESSFSWGSQYTCWTTEGPRGISHGDVIDLNRENIPGFDVREAYVQLAASLKKRGY